jgi:hypothetical protein
VAGPSSGWERTRRTPQGCRRRWCTGEHWPPGDDWIDSFAEALPYRSGVLRNVAMNRSSAFLAAAS